MEYIVSTNGLTKKFGKHLAVNGVNLQIKKGEIYGFIGRNGAGKTTCMKLICGLSSPTSGEISLFGKNGEEKEEYYGRIGNLIEAPGLYPNLNAYDNLKLKSICMGISRAGYIEEILELVGLTGVTKKTKKYSLGMKQRLGIAMALVGEPDLLILDEPINGLDPQGIAGIREVILRINREKNMTIMISSHILDELSKVVDTYGIIHDGCMVEQLSKEELAQKCSSYIEIKTKESNKACVVLDKMEITEYKVIDPTTICIYERLQDIGTINKQLALEDCILQGIRIVEQELEDYYLEVTGGSAHA